VRIRVEEDRLEVGITNGKAFRSRKRSYTMRTRYVSFQRTIELGVAKDRKKLRP
jgi:hypothetical protein